MCVFVRLLFSRVDCYQKSLYFHGRTSCSALWVKISIDVTFFTYISKRLPCLIRIIRLLQYFFFHFLLILYDFKSPSSAHLIAFGLKTLTPKNAAWTAFQNPLAHISGLTSCSLVVWCWRLSPVSSCRSGSTQTFLQTFVTNDTVMFLMLLRPSDTNPPFLHGKACVRSDFMPDSQTDGNLDSAQLYLIRTSPQKSCLVRW